MQKARVAEWESAAVTVQDPWAPRLPSTLLLLTAAHMCEYLLSATGCDRPLNSGVYGQ